MHILIANDDGVFAPGIAALYDSLEDYAQCSVVAPMQDMSGVSSALTLDRPLYPHELANGYIGVDGTPVDCVHLGLNGLLETRPDMVVSGINLGPNLGNDVVYSGTVAAATEGRFARSPAFAFSLAGKTVAHLADAARIARMIVEHHETLRVPAQMVINVNIPDLPLAEIKGIRLTRLGQRSLAGAPQKMVNPRGKQGYWIAAVGIGKSDDEGTDFHAVRNGYVSVTPLHLDCSFHEALEPMSSLERLL